MNTSYVGFLKSDGAAADTYIFREYLLDQDTMIIPDMWDLVCSPGVAKKIKEDPSQVKDKLFYRDDDTLYFIYSRYFEGIGTVKLFYDTSSYVQTQMTIMKTGLIFIFLVFIAQFFAGRYITKRLLRNLRDIANNVGDIDINTKQQRIVYGHMPEDDEIRILAHALNSSYDTIETQTAKLKQFLTDVSHEFKTPLMAMSSKLDLANKKREKSQFHKDDEKEVFESFRWNIWKLNGLLESLFFLSRIEEQSWCLVKKDIDVKAFFEQKTSQVSESFPHKNIKIDFDITEDLRYKVEESTFGILVENLLSNAMKFSPEDTKLSIKATQKYFSIWDNWPWIPKDERDKIWEKFYRTDTNKEGFWVGLYLVKRIADIYNWNIKISSPVKRGWTVFKVHISEHV